MNKHDIINKLNAAGTVCEVFIANYEEGFYKDKTKEEIGEMANKDMKTIITNLDEVYALLDCKKDQEML